jgi:hypothetical protein
MPARRCLLVLVRLADGTSTLSVAEILKRSRERHDPLAIAGAMLFDGERLGLLLCGALVQVGQAFEAFLADAGQACPRVLADAPQPPPWASPGWKAGWSEPDALAPLEADDTARGDTALELWRGLVEASDLL